MKICKGCGVEKSLVEFPSNGGGTVKARCKPCYNEYTATWREGADKDKLRSQWRKASSKRYSGLSENEKRLRVIAKYGLTVVEYDRMFAEQGGLCKICEEAKPLVVDHCHQTGEVRGLLCSLCNTGLGSFFDRAEYLQRAVEYLSYPGHVESLDDASASPATT